MSFMASGGTMNWTVTTSSSTGNWFTSPRVFVNGNIYNPLVPDEMRKAVVPNVIESNALDELSRKIALMEEQAVRANMAQVMFDGLDGLFSTSTRQWRQPRRRRSK